MVVLHRQTNKQTNRAQKPPHPKNKKTITKDLDFVFGCRHCDDIVLKNA